MNTPNLVSLSSPMMTEAIPVHPDIFEAGSSEEQASARKLHPTCYDVSLRKEAMSTRELSSLCFSFPILQSSSRVPRAVDDHFLEEDVFLSPSQLSQSSHFPALACPAPAMATISTSSSVCSISSSSDSFKRNHNMQSLVDNHYNINHYNNHLSTVMKSEQINAKVTSQRTSRQGRSCQRWVTDPIQSNNSIRLTTGCIPILGDGKVLFVSANRKAEWIFPKGGWEQDESMEESAIRESYEEAGVIGVLGPPLSEVQHETRKARKRRLEQQKLQQQQHRQQEFAHHQEENNGLVHIEEALTRIRELDSQSSSQRSSFCSRTDNSVTTDTSSVTSDTSTKKQYTHVRMTLFPLYVSSVKESWPENGRLRKAVPIDEAIRMLESRPELQIALKEVKEKGLHLLHH